MGMYGDGCATSAQLPRLMATRHCLLCVPANAEKPVTVADANASVTINDFNIFVLPKLHMFSPAARRKANGLVASQAARQFVP
jgi:hypothetical protein